MFIAYGCLMMGYAALVFVLLKRGSSPGRGMTPWVILDASLRGCSGLLVLIAAFATGASKILLVCAGVALVVDAVLGRVAKRRLRKAGLLTEGDGLT